MTPDQPGSAPSKRPSAAESQKAVGTQFTAAEVLAHLRRHDDRWDEFAALHNDPDLVGRNVVIRRALRLLARVEATTSLKAWIVRLNADPGWTQLSPSLGLVAFLRDLADLVAPTDAEDR